MYTPTLPILLAPFLLLSTSALASIPTTADDITESPSRLAARNLHTLLERERGGDVPPSCSTGDKLHTVCPQIPNMNPPTWDLDSCHKQGLDCYCGKDDKDGEASCACCVGG
ncbi:MAG: hypothetical protein M1836_006097 [Candelina mexicana]|nr:MAG: hypothetical protein M1836_006097 [Candelina mexicana]